MLDRLDKWGLSPFPILEDCSKEVFSGKSLRSRLVKFISKELKLDSDRVRSLSYAIEFIHFATLLHDDVCDRSLYRRNTLAKWKKFSEKEAVLAGDFLLVSAYLEVAANRSFDLMDYSASITSDLVVGELLQDDMIRKKNFSEESITKIHKLKTGSLFSWCFVAPFLIGPLLDVDKVSSNFNSLKDSLHKMGLLLGILFQRSDDLIDFNVRNEEGKSILGDLHSGYLNSFGRTLLDNPLSKKEGSQLLTIESFNKHIGGDSVFQNALNNFDKQSAVIIEDYFEKAKQICEDFNLSLSFCKKLQSLGEGFYKRKIPSWF